jgi:DnaK suppressor protein
MTNARGASLTAAELTVLAAEIATELERLERSISISGDAAAPVALDQTAVGRVSRADALQNQQLSVSMHTRSLARHTELLDAQRRIERGEYGVCQQCGALIPFGRLLVFPEARWCAACGGSRE